MNNEQLIEIQMLQSQNKVNINDLHEATEEKYNIFRNDELFLDCLHLEDATNLISWYSRLFKNDKFKIKKCINQ